MVVYAEDESDVGFHHLRYTSASMDCQPSGARSCNITSGVRSVANRRPNPNRICHISRPDPNVIDRRRGFLL
jgi:hypothetical protein